MPNNWSDNPYMHMMNLPHKYEPMMEMPQEQLESMFPRCYYIIYPEVCRHCDRMISKKGTMHTPTREEMENIVDDIDNRVGHEVEAEYEDNDYAENPETMDVFENYQKDDDRQFGFGGGFFGGRRRFRRDLISIILLRELLRRRRRPHYGYGFVYGYPGEYGWY